MKRIPCYGNESIQCKHEQVRGEAVSRSIKLIPVLDHSRNSRIFKSFSFSLIQTDGRRVPEPVLMQMSLRGLNCDRLFL